MPQSTSAIVATPTTYITKQALAMGDAGDPPVAVSAINPLPVSDKAFGSVLALMPGASDAIPRRAIRIACTAPGTIAMKLADDSVETVPVEVGLSILPYAIKAIVVAGTTATASFASLA